MYSASYSVYSSTSSISEEDSNFPGLFIPDDDLDMHPKVVHDSPISDEYFADSTENELTCVEKSEEFDDEDPLNAKVVMLASLMADQCITESKKVVSAQGKLKTAIGSTGTLDSNNSGSTVDLGERQDELEHMAYSIVSSAIDEARLEVAERFHEVPLCRAPPIRSRPSHLKYPYSTYEPPFGTLWSHSNVQRGVPLPPSKEIISAANNIVTDIIHNALNTVSRSSLPSSNSSNVDEYKIIATTIVMNAIESAKLNLSSI